MTGSTKEGVTAELYVRSLAPSTGRTAQEEVVEKLDRLSDRGTFAEYSVIVCGRHAPASPAEADDQFGAYLCNRVAVFEQWAAHNGWSLGSLFERRSVHSSITGETNEMLVMPVMVLAEYEGAALRFVAPCTTDETHWNVPDRLDSLVSNEGTPGTPLPGAQGEPPARSPPVTQ